MAHGKETKEALRQAYIFDGMPIELCATRYDVSVATARRWKYTASEQGDDWDKLRIAHNGASGKVEDIAKQTIAGFLVQYQSVMESLIQAPDVPALAKAQALSSLADAYNKILAANNRLMPEISALSVALTVIQLMTDFVGKSFPQHAQVFIEILEPFAHEVEREFA